MEYPYARKSKYPNQGEDLELSRRHLAAGKTNARRSKDSPRKKPAPHINHIRYIDDDMTVEEAIEFLIQSGIRGIQFGNWIPEIERPKHVKQLAKSVSRLIEIPFFSSRINNLGISVGGRGRGNAVAHYEPNSRVINLTRDCFGSLAHEVGHFFDYTAIEEGVHSNLVQVMSGQFSFANAVVDCGYYKRVLSKLTLGEMRYWLKPIEIFARVFETWVATEIIPNCEYLGRVDKYTLTPYPNEEEREVLFPVMMDLFNSELTPNTKGYVYWESIRKEEVKLAKLRKESEAVVAKTEIDSFKNGGLYD